MNASPLIDMSTLLESEAKDLPWAQIRVRVDLANQLVGTLYKGILADQIGALVERRDAVTHAPRTPMIRAMITGHRPNKLSGYGPSPLQDAIRLWMRAELSVLLAAHGTDLRAISGMALGVDTWWAEEALALAVPLHAYIPFVGQENIWPRASQEHYQSLIERAEVAVVCSEGGYGASKMQLRNKRMVDDADVHLAVWDGTPGGTANCVGYMEQRGFTPRRFPGLPAPTPATIAPPVAQQSLFRAGSS